MGDDVSLANGHDLMKDAMLHGYALAAFNAQNWDYIGGIIEGTELSTSCLLQLGEGTLEYIPIDVIGPMARQQIEAARVPIGLHLDHAHHLDLCFRALDLGFTSVMFDGSRYEDDVNIKMTSVLVQRAQAYNVPVEGEIGLVDKEDLISMERISRFVQETEVDWLATPFGTRHGGAPSKEGVRIDRIGDTFTQLQKPLVLHGASGVANEVLRQAVRMGVRKVNIGTHLHRVYRDVMTEYIQRDQADPRPFWLKTRHVMAQSVAEIIVNLRSAGAALV